MKRFIFLLLMFLVSWEYSFAQKLDISAEVRPRFESRHGYKSLFSKDDKAANFVSQRTRLNLRYDQSKLRLGLTLQNVRVWGDVSTLSPRDNANSFHEAWAEAVLSDKFSLKMGRQEIVYDDHRIFGNVGWAQQARSHDALIAKITPDAKNRIDVGLAINADAQGLKGDFYSNAAGYKNFQYAWYHGSFDRLGLSVLLLNTGLEYEDDQAKRQVSNMQTSGARLTYKTGKMNASLAGYFQSGKKITSDVSASYFAAGLGYKMAKGVSLGAAVEYLSGKDMTDTTSNFKSFTPLFGTNHKFNGWMDYFYVGNHVGSVGLLDVNATLGYKSGAFSAKLIPHLFSAPGKIVDQNGKEMSSNLGTEVDFVMGYKIAKSVVVKAGYSVMLATDTMEVLKGGSKDAGNSWGWVMFVFKPKLLSYTVEKK